MCACAGDWSLVSITVKKGGGGGGGGVGMPLIQLTNSYVMCNVLTDAAISAPNCPTPLQTLVVNVGIC